MKQTQIRDIQYKLDTTTHNSDICDQYINLVNRDKLSPNKAINSLARSEGVTEYRIYTVLVRGL